MEEIQKLTLGDLCRKVKNGASSFYLKDGTVPIRCIRHINVGENHRIDTASVKPELARESARTRENLLKSGDILMSVRGPEKIAIVPPEADGYYFSAEFIALEIDREKIHPEIVAAYLAMPEVSAYLNSKNEGRVLRSVSPKDILALEIAVPDTETQKYLSELLELIAEQKSVISAEQEKLESLQDAAVGRYLGGQTA